MKISAYTEIADLLNRFLNASNHAAELIFCACEEDKKISKKAKFEIFNCLEEIEKEANRLLQIGKFVEIPKMYLLSVRDLARSYISSYQMRFGNEELAKKWFKQAAVYGINIKIRFCFEEKISQDLLQTLIFELENMLGYSAKKDWSSAAIWLDRIQCKLTPFFSFVPYLVCRLVISTLLFLIHKNKRPEAIQIAICKHGIPDWDLCPQCVESQALLGYYYLNDNKSQLGKYLLEKACKVGSYEALLLKVICLLKGTGYPQDKQQALKLLQTIKSNNEAEDINKFAFHIEYLPRIYYLLGDLYKNGVAGEKYRIQGEELIKKALILGFNPKNDYFVGSLWISHNKQNQLTTAILHEDQPKPVVEKILHFKRHKTTTPTKRYSIFIKLSSFLLAIASLPKIGWLQLTTSCKKKKDIKNLDEDLFAEDQTKPTIKKAKSIIITKCSDISSKTTAYVNKRVNFQTNTTKSEAIANDEMIESESQPGTPITPRSDSSASSLDIQPGRESPASFSQPSCTGSPVLQTAPVNIVKHDSNLIAWPLHTTPAVSTVIESSEIKFDEEYQKRLAYRVKMAELFGVDDRIRNSQILTSRVYSEKELLDEYKINLGELRKTFPPLVNSVLVNLGKDHEVRIGGGVVRKLILFGKANGDWDITTTAPPDTIQQVIKSLESNVCKLQLPQGKIPVWTLIAADGLGIDVTPFLRYESYRGGKYELVISEKEIDPMTRNLSINSLFLRRKKGSWEWELVDLTGHGLKDLMVDKVIRINGDPNIIFHLDPIRLIHCFYFKYELGFKFEEITQKGIRSFKSFLSGLSMGDKSLQLLKMLFKILKLPSMVRQGCLLELKEEGVLKIVIDILEKGFSNTNKYPSNFVHFYQTYPSMQPVFDHLIHLQNLNTLDKNGQLILHKTIVQGNIIGVALLLCGGANPLIKDKFQFDAYSIIEQYIHDTQHKKIFVDLMQDFFEISEKEMVNRVCNLMKANVLTDSVVKPYCNGLLR